MLPHLEKSILSLVVRNPHAFFQELLPRSLLHVGGGLAAQLILTVAQKFANGCPRRARTSGGAVDDRVR